MKFHLRDTDGYRVKYVLFAHSILEIDKTHAHTHTQTQNGIHAHRILLARTHIHIATIRNRHAYDGKHELIEVA